MCFFKKIFDKVLRFSFIYNLFFIIHSTGGICSACSKSCSIYKYVFWSILLLMIYNSLRFMTFHNQQGRKSIIQISFR
uniref:Uncharacterized protein n=1 Tax=Octopus bimaculoides TaxID=37653 RepID=A0A0L8G6V7_OCTBM